MSKHRQAAIGRRKAVKVLKAFLGSKEAPDEVYEALKSILDAYHRGEHVIRDAHDQVDLKDARAEVFLNMVEELAYKFAAIKPDGTIWDGGMQVVNDAIHLMIQEGRWRKVPVQNSEYLGAKIIPKTEREGGNRAREANPGVV